MTLKQKKDPKENKGQNTNQKSSIKSRWPVLLCVVLGIVVGVVVGFALIETPPAAEKIFAVEDLRITLTEDFTAFEKVQYQTLEFQTRLKTFTGWTAQIIQHEIDHCDGILI